MPESAKARGSRITNALAEAGGRLGLDPVLEYPVPGGKVDVVWMWEGPAAFPARLPLVGFEVESSWRTRKHLKGDLVNLLELQPALGVIVLLGEGADVDATRTFAREMAARRALRIEVWDEGRVASLEPDGAAALAAEVVRAANPRDAAHAAQHSIGHSGKYRRLASWLGRQDADTIALSFGEIEEVAGLPLPPSCRAHVPHWHSYTGSAVARAIIDAGWRARDVDLASEMVRFERAPSGSSPHDRCGSS